MTALQMDTLASIIPKLTNYSDFDREGNIYETMVNSGKIQLLRNQEIVNQDSSFGTTL